MLTIARKVGVSKPVVYTVLNNREGKGIFVSEKTRTKILKTAEELGYVPPKSAKELFTGRSDNIGLLIHRLTPFVLPVFNGLIQEARKNNLEVTPYVTNGDPALEEYYLNQMRDGRVDAVIAISSLDGSLDRYRKFSNPPYNLKVLYTGGTECEDLHSVFHNSHMIGSLAAGHLMDIGCNSFGFFGAYKTNKALKGFVDFLDESGRPAPLIFVGEPNVRTFEEEVELARRFVQEGNLPEGIMAGNDSQAAILLSELLRHGIKVPDDVALIGCDNTELCRCTHPNLSSVDTSNLSTASAAVKAVKDIIEGTVKDIVKTEMPVSLVIRESTSRGNR